MVRIKINLSEVSDAPGLIEPGRFSAKLTSCEEQDSSKGNPMLVWSWEIMEGDNAGANIKSFTSLLDNALFGMKQHLVAFGCDPKGLADVDTDKFVGRRVILTVGKARIKSRETGEDIDVSRVIRVDAAKGGKPGAAKVVSSAKVASGDEDIPF